MDSGDHQRTKKPGVNRDIRSLSANIAAHGSSSARTTKSERDLSADRAVPMEARGAAKERAAKNGLRRSERSRTAPEQEEKGITTVMLYAATATARTTKGCDEERTKYLEEGVRADM